MKFAPLTIPSSFSPSLASFVESLLVRHPLKRLGGKGGTGQVKRHAFFQYISWEAVLSKKVIPPIRPCEDGGRKEGGSSSAGSGSSGQVIGGGGVTCRSPVCRLQGHQRDLDPSLPQRLNFLSNSYSSSPTGSATAAGKGEGGRHPLNKEEGEEWREGGGEEEGEEECPHEYTGTENFEKEFTGLDVASAFEVLEPLSPHSNAIFANFSTEPTIRLLRWKGGREGRRKGSVLKEASEEDLGLLGVKGSAAVVSVKAGEGGRGGGRWEEIRGPSGA